MKLPQMPYTPSLKKTFQQKFGGYNHNVGAADGEIYDMLNLTSDHYPVLSTRGKRYDAGSLNANNGIIYINDEQYRAHGTGFYHNDTLIGTVTDSEKKFAKINNKLIIYPDKKYFNIDSLDAKGTYETLTALESAITSPSVNDIYLVGSSAPYAIYYWDGDEWVMNKYTFGDLGFSIIDRLSSFPADSELYNVSASANTITILFAYYTDKIEGLYPGDAVKISGCVRHPENNKTLIIQEVAGATIRFNENSFILDSEWYPVKTGQYSMAFADSIATNPFYTNLYDLYIDTDKERIKFKYDPSQDSSVFDSYDNKCWIPEDHYVIYRNEKLYLHDVDDVNNYHNSELSTYTVYQKIITHNNGTGLRQSDIVKIDNKDLCLIVDDEYYSLTLTEQQYNSVLNKECIVLFDSSTLVYIESVDSSVILEIMSGISNQWGSELSFLSKYIDTVEHGLTIERVIPDMDFIVGHNNRIWGCKDDTIYASKLGDPFNFNVFDGLATDSYAVESGTPGDFTAAFSYLGYPLFFKEDAILKIYGDKPSEYQIVNTAKNGVKAGSARSFAIAGETLYYHNKSGIMAYTGGVPSLVSVGLGETIYHNGIAGSDGSKYYIDMLDALNVHHLFVYDPLRQLWMKEETDGIPAFVNYDGELWAYDGNLITMSAKEAPSGASTEADFDWMMETADIVADSPDKKGISKFQLRCEIDGSMKISLQCDGGSYVEKQTFADETKRTLLIPIIPQRADYYRLKLEGKGSFKLFGLTIEYYDGSEI